MRRLVAVVVPVVLAVALPGCFKGAEREKEAPPGVPGGLCLAPDGHCDAGTCNQQENYCFDPTDPCKGFFCGGSDRGLCSVTTDAQPSCTCNNGFQNRTFTLYCCPEDGGNDPNCIEMPDSGDGSGSGSGSAG